MAARGASTQTRLLNEPSNGAKKCLRPKLIYCKCYGHRGLEANRPAVDGIVQRAGPPAIASPYLLRSYAASDLYSTRRLQWDETPFPFSSAMQSSLPVSQLWVFPNACRQKLLFETKIPRPRVEAVSFLLRSPGLLRTLVVCQMSVPRRGSRKLRAALRTVRFRRSPGLFPLMSEEIAKCRELSAVTSVFPALRLGPLVEYSDGGVVASDRLRQRVVYAAADERRRIAHTLT